MRFVHTADWQLGMTRRWLTADAGPRFGAARRDVLSRIAAVAAEEAAEFIVVSGDVFESNHESPAVVSQSWEAMRRFGAPVYLLPGNHDPLDASSVFTGPLSGERPDNVVVLDRAGRYEVRPGVEIVAAPWRSKKPTHDLVAEVLDGLEADGTVRVLVAHGSVDALDPDPSRPQLIALAAVEDALARGALHYVALGDKHSRTSIGATGRIWYAGAPEVTDFDNVEADSGHVLVVDVDEAAPGRPVDVAARRVGRWRFLSIERTVDDGRDVADLDVNLDQLPDKERTAVRLGLSGTLSVVDRARLDTTIDRYARLFASLTLWESRTELLTVASHDDFDGLGLGGFAADAVQDLLAAAAEGPQSADAQAALALLRRLADRSVA